jgi:hypothetical protein
MEKSLFFIFGKNKSGEKQRLDARLDDLLLFTTVVIDR